MDDDDDDDNDDVLVTSLSFLLPLQVQITLLVFSYQKPHSSKPLRTKHQISYQYTANDKQQYKGT